MKLLVVEDDAETRNYMACRSKVIRSTCNRESSSLIHTIRGAGYVLRLPVNEAIGADEALRLMEAELSWFRLTWRRKASRILLANSFRLAGLMDSLRQVSSDIARDLRTPLTRLYQRLEGARSRRTTG